MAQRRMFSLRIIDTDEFLNMPLSSRLLYYDLSMRADDDGFVGSPKKIMRFVGATEDDFKVLCSKQFLIPFETGVCVIRDWKIHNYIQNDRYTETHYKIEKAQLKQDENGAYTKCIQDVSSLDSQVRLELGKDRLELGKVRVKNKELDFKNDSIKNHPCYLPPSGESHPVENLPPNALSSNNKMLKEEKIKETKTKDNSDELVSIETIFKKLYKEKYNIDYIENYSKDRQILKTLLKKLNVQGVVSAIKTYFNNEFWFTKDSRSILNLASKINDVLILGSSKSIEPIQETKEQKRQRNKKELLEAIKKDRVCEREIKEAIEDGIITELEAELAKSK